MAKTLLPNGLYSKFDLKEDGWNDEVNSNFELLNALIKGSVISAIPGASIPALATDGDTYIDTDTQELVIWYCNKFNRFKVPTGWLFLEENNDAIFYFDENGTKQPASSGGGVFEQDQSTNVASLITPGSVDLQNQDLINVKDLFTSNNLSVGNNINLTDFNPIINHTGGGTLFVSTSGNGVRYDIDTDNDENFSFFQINLDGAGTNDFAFRCRKEGSLARTVVRQLDVYAGGIQFFNGTLNTVSGSGNMLLSANTGYMWIRSANDNNASLIAGTNGSNATGKVMLKVGDASPTNENGAGLIVDPDKNVRILEGMNRSVTTLQTGAITYTTASETFIYTQSNQPLTITLSDVDHAAGIEKYIKDIGGVAGTHTVTIQGENGKLIDGQATQTMTVDYGFGWFKPTATGWAEMGG